jgi:hypothetical protein
MIADRSGQSRFVDGCILVLIYFAVAAASFNGFYDKWNFRDGQTFPGVSIEAMLNGTADRPFIYRSLLPWVANRVDAALPAGIKNRILAKAVLPDGSLMTKIKSSVARDPRYLIRYHLIYFMAFLFLFASMFPMRAVCAAAEMDVVSSTLAPVILVLFLPFLLTVGGYFYDLSEMFFLMSATALAMSRRYWALLLIAALGALNKESFVLFLPALYPLLRMRLSPRRAAIFNGGLLAIAGVIGFAVSRHFHANPGPNAEFHLGRNMLFYLNPRNLFQHEVNYGLVTFRGYNIVFVLMIAVLLLRGWKPLPVRIRQHIAIAAAIDLPLFFIVCAPGELRNLSLLYPGLLFLVGQSIALWVAGISRPASKERRTESLP